MIDPGTKLVSLALSLAGLSDAPSTRDRYLACIAPPEIEGGELSAEMGREWSCYLTTLGLWRMAGVPHPILRLRYVSGTAPARVSAVGRSAWRRPEWQNLPNVGDAVVVRAGDHIVACVTRVGDGTADTIEGGQVDADGFMAIERFEGHRLAYDSAGTLYLGGAPVLGWYDCRALGIPDDAAEDPGDPVAGDGKDGAA